jgi:hypothetical protein
LLKLPPLAASFSEKDKNVISGIEIN